MCVCANETDFPWNASANKGSGWSCLVAVTRATPPTVLQTLYTQGGHTQSGIFVTRGWFSSYIHFQAKLDFWVRRTDGWGANKLFNEQCTFFARIELAGLSASHAKMSSHPALETSGFLGSYLCLQAAPLLVRSDLLFFTLCLLSMLSGFEAYDTDFDLLYFWRGSKFSVLT